LDMPHALPRTFLPLIFLCGLTHAYNRYVMLLAYLLCRPSRLCLLTPRTCHAHVLPCLITFSPHAFSRPIGVTAALPYCPGSLTFGSFYGFVYQFSAFTRLSFWTTVKAADGWLMIHGGRTVWTLAAFSFCLGSGLAGGWRRRRDAAAQHSARLHGGSIHICWTPDGLVRFGSDRCSACCTCTTAQHVLCACAPP